MGCMIYVILNQDDQINSSLIFDKKQKMSRSQHIQSMQKDAMISSLKKQLYELKDKQHDFLPLENEVTNIESKYDMLEDQRQRIQDQHKIKLEINRKNIFEWRTQGDGVRMQIHKSSVNIQEVIREITGLKRACENREAQIAALLVNQQEINAKNQQISEENRNKTLQIKAHKEERNVIELQNERYLLALEENLQVLKMMQKQGRSLEAANSKLVSILNIAEKDNQELTQEVRGREEIVQTTYRKLDSLNAEIDELRQKSKRLQKDCIKSQQDYAHVTKQLQSTIQQNKERAKRLKICQNQLRLIENDHDVAVLDRDALYNDHQSLSSENKALNEDIDHVLMQIMEAERINNQYKKELENYIRLDQEARKMLDREDLMAGLLKSVNDKLGITGDTIAHLR